MSNFSSGSKTSENSFIHIGVGSFTIASVCPSEEELKELYGSNAKAIQYSKVDETDGKNSATAHIILNLLDDVGNENPVYKRATFYIKEIGFANKDKTKLQVINKYGDTMWVTKEEFQANVPAHYNPNFIMPYRPAFIGEEQLIGFIKTYLGIPMSREFSDNQWKNKTADQLAMCEASFSIEEFKKMCAGDFSLLKSILSMQPNNKIKFMLGVRTTEQGQFQDVYTRHPINFNARNFNRVVKEINDAINSGNLNDVYYDTDNLTLRKYQNNTTDNPLTNTMTGSASDNPFESASSTSDLPW